MIDRNILGDLERLLRPLRNRVANMINRGVVSLVSDAFKMQLIQASGLPLEIVEGDKGVEHFQPYGFSSVPLTGAEVLLLFPNGDHSHPLAIAASDRRHRPTAGQAGEVCMYTDEGDVIRLGRGHVVSVATSGQVRLGSAAASIPPALATELADLKARIAAWVPVPNDGGASLKPVIAAWPVPGSTKVRVE